jgi:hypothetical protein
MYIEAGKASIFIANGKSNNVCMIKLQWWAMQWMFIINDACFYVIWIVKLIFKPWKKNHTIYTKTYKFQC